MLIVKNISKNFNGLKVLDDVSFECTGKGILGIVGPNGSGKTTLLNIISGNIMPDVGEIIYAGNVITNYPLHKRAALGVVRTYQEGKVFPSHTLRENLLLVKTIENNNSGNSDIEQLLEKVGLKEKINNPASTLSFGQIRRLQLAMAMMRKGAKLYLFDEPTSGTDIGFMDYLKEILRDLKVNDKGVIIVEHNLDFIREVADQIIVLEGGKVLAIGTPEEVFQLKEVHDAYLGGIYAS